jgi:2-oxoglutarate ferredoxin oxidoreductase subunit delta
MVLEITREWCKGCGLCVELCPNGALSLDQHQKAVWDKREQCVACGSCQLRCPDMAIELERKA